MTAPQHETDSTRPAQRPLRLVLTKTPHRSPIDGVWWPLTRDLAADVPDLIDRFPPYSGRVSRILFSPPDWDRPHDAQGRSAPWPRSVDARRGRVKVGSFPADDTHLMVLVMSGAPGQRLQLLVLPADLDPEIGSRLMVEASEPQNRRTAAQLLAAAQREPRPPHRVRRGADVGAWDDDGGAPSPSGRLQDDGAVVDGDAIR